jgi:hypothetical protein
VDVRFAASLAFVLVVFPVAAAVLLYVALGGGRGKPSDGAGAGTRKGAEAPADPAGPAPAPPARPFPPAPDPPEEPAGKAAKAPSEGAVRGIPRSDLEQILRNLRESGRAAAPSAAPPALGDPLPGAQGPKPPQDAREAERLLASADPAVRLEGVLRVANDASAAPLLLKALEDGDPFVRSTAAASLGRRGDPSAIGSLLGLIRDPDLEVRRTASRSLLDLAGIRFKPVEDMSAEELEQAKKMIDRILEQRGGR